MDILSNGDSAPCESFRTGHGVHYIQAFRSAPDPGTACTVVAVGDDGVVTLAHASGSVWHHDPRALRRALENAGSSEVIYKANWSVLVVQGPTPERKLLFSVSNRAEREVACRSVPTSSPG